MSQGSHELTWQLQKLLSKAMSAAISIALQAIGRAADLQHVLVHRVTMMKCTRATMAKRPYRRSPQAKCGDPGKDRIIASLDKIVTQSARKYVVVKKVGGRKTCPGIDPCAA